MSIEIPGFEKLEELARSRTSIVYRGDDSTHDRQVAIKVLNTVGRDESSRLAFEREIQTMGRLGDHPNIVGLIGSGFSEDDRPYIVMPFYRRGSYASLVDEQGALTWQKVLDVGVKIASALEAIHRRDLVHRDIKPANVFVGEFGNPILADFGITSTVSPRLDGYPTVVLAATLGFSAPEVLNGRRPTVLSDICSLGATLFSLAKGEPAYQGSDVELMNQVTSDDLPPILSDPVPKSLSALIAEVMAKEPSDRPRTALEVAQRLVAIQKECKLDPTPIVVDSAEDVDLSSPEEEMGAGDVSAPSIKQYDLPSPIVDESDDGEVPSLESEHTRHVGELERPTEPVEIPLAPRRGFRRPSVAKPSLVRAAIAALGAMVAIGAFSMLTRPETDQTPIEPAAARESPWSSSPRVETSWMGHEGPVRAVQWSGDDQRIASGGQDKTLRVWNPEDVDEPSAVLALTGWVLDLDWSPDDSKLAIADSAGIVTVWDVQTESKLEILDAHNGPVESVAWDPSGQRIASAGRDGTVRTWDLLGDALLTIDDHGGVILSVSWSAGGDWLASGSHDGTVRTWDASTGKPAIAIAGESWVRRVSWAPTGELLASANEGRLVQVWNGRSGAELRQWETVSDPVGQLDWSPDGTNLAVGLEEGWSLFVLQTESQPGARLDLLGSTVPALDWANAKQQLVVGTAGGTIEIWEPSE